MKRIFLFSLFCLLLLLSCATGKKEEALPSPPVVEDVDWAGKLEYNENSNSAKVEATVKSYIDGDTVHFNVPENVVRGGILKARFLAVNTPESTGKIEEWGKAASRFTKEKLMGADSIIVESDDGAWNLDSTGSRYLVWVWYKPDEASDYRNLNIELLQNGLAVPYSASNNRYGDTCVAAVSQARNSKLNVFSGQPDPDFYYGDAVELTIRELREHPEEYRDKKVAFTGIITVNDGGTIGSVMAVQNAGLSDQVLVFGHDGSDQISSMILDDNCPLQAVVAQDPYGQGYKAMTALINAIKGGDYSATKGKCEFLDGIVLSCRDKDAVNAWRVDNGFAEIK